MSSDKSPSEPPPPTLQPPPPPPPPSEPFKKGIDPPMTR
jgi:hypothetical protein